MKPPDESAWLIASTDWMAASKRSLRPPTSSTRRSASADPSRPLRGRCGDVSPAECETTFHAAKEPAQTERGCPSGLARRLAYAAKGPGRCVKFPHCPSGRARAHESV